MACMLYCMRAVQARAKVVLNVVHVFMHDMHYVCTKYTGETNNI